MQKKSASSALSAKSQNRAGSNLWESVKSVGLEREKKIPKDYLLCLSLQKKCHVLKIGSLKASAGKYLTKCIFLHIFRKYFFAIPCCVKCPYLVKCLPKLPPFSISASNNFPRFSSIGAIIFFSDSPNASCSTYITALANFISTLFPRQYFSNAKIIKSSTSRTSHTLPYTYQDYLYRIFLPSFSRHASLLVPPYNAQDYLEHPCHNHSPRNVLLSPNPSSGKYRMVAQPNGSLAPEASPPCSIPCRYHPEQSHLCAATSLCSAAHDT